MKTINTCIETELVCSDNGKNTYCITKRLKGVEGDTGIIVMLFPTRNAENLNSDDSTINHIIAHMGDFGFNEIKIINLFSRVISARPFVKGLVADTENMKFIEDNILDDKNITDNNVSQIYNKEPIMASKEVIDAMDIIKETPVTPKNTSKSVRYMIRIKRFIKRKYTKVIRKLFRV